MQKQILLIDNHDSFTYNLVHLTEEVSGIHVDILQNDNLKLNTLHNYSHIIISPGPGLPYESGQLMHALKSLNENQKVFGVCLGLQAIVELFGGTLENLQTVQHGIASELFIVKKDSLILKDLPQSFKAGRYHSWVASKDKLPKELSVNCMDANHQIMGIEHHTRPIYAVQFHPESIMTPEGAKIIENFLNIN